MEPFPRFRPEKRYAGVCGWGRVVGEGVIDGFVKSPISALRFILRHCGVRQVHLIPQDSQALTSGFLRIRRECDFLRVYRGWLSFRIRNPCPFDIQFGPVAEGTDESFFPDVRIRKHPACATDPAPFGSGWQSCRLAPAAKAKRHRRSFRSACLDGGPRLRKTA